MKSQIIALCCVLGVMATQNVTAFADVSPDRLRCDNRVNPLGIDALPPRLSWIVTSDQIGQRQTAYEILVATSQPALDQNTGDLWDSGKVLSDDPPALFCSGRDRGQPEPGVGVEPIAAACPPWRVGIQKF